MQYDVNFTLHQWVISYVGLFEPVSTYTLKLTQIQCYVFIAFKITKHTINNQKQGRLKKSWWRLQYNNSQHSHRIRRNSWFGW